LNDKLAELQISDIVRTGLDFAPLHPFDDVGQCLMRRRRNTHFVASGRDESVDIIDLRAAFFDDILAGRRTSLFRRPLTRGQDRAFDFL